MTAASGTNLQEKAQPPPAPPPRSDSPIIEYVPANSNPQAAIEVTRRICTLQERLRKAPMDSVMSLVAAVEAKDINTHRHSLNVSVYAEMIARLMGLTQADVEIVRIAATLHDVGKIAVPDSILSKPGKLAPMELRMMQQHPAIGAEIIKPVMLLDKERPLVLHHHEWYNGAGYPYGLCGAEIPMGARILHVADSIDAMLSPRAYKAAYTIQRTVDELEKGSGTQFDPKIAAAAITWLHANRTLILNCSQGAPNPSTTPST